MKVQQPRIMHCPFCDIIASDDQSSVIVANASAVAIYDAYPVTRGHALIIPKRHVGSFFAATAEERGDMLTLLDRMKAVLDERFHPDSFNIGINDGPAAGQTVPHVHVHLIPRYRVEASDPRGGVRWIIPEKAQYWD
jgi:diadenosine tetraphosphate (Ap4A) HIT family hydrolase